MGMDGFGTQLRRGNGATPIETFTTIAEVTNISGPSMERETLDMTSHSSPDKWREFIGGIKDGGEVSIDMNYDIGEATHNALQEDFDDEDPRHFQIVFPDDVETAWEVNLVLTKLEPEYPYDDKMACSAAWKVSGKPNLTALGS
ncbi:phage tail tube protein [Parafrankia sp. EUN1f]|uniref:phage tail tube protein n=1 Tax=Parafrankia sp. EUN1f TaxID=102897 RepID=UPI0001C4530B|nr:phage tail tube protein [Parafrankia sp. EUN1f]EFC78983.1 outer capsid protein Hoc [Parafrankia sp. EUN1f]